MKAITTNDNQIIPYKMIVSIWPIGDNYHFFDTLGKMHKCTPLEYEKFLAWLETL